MSDGVVRISVTIPRSLYREFESTAKAAGFRKRSRAVSEALKRFITEYKSLEALPEGMCTGVITFTYFHDIPGLLDTLTDLQHKYSGVIAASLHVHLDEKRCLETIVIRGNTETFRKLIEKLKTLRTENVQYVVMPLKGKR